MKNIVINNISLLSLLLPCCKKEAPSPDSRCVGIAPLEKHVRIVPSGKNPNVFLSDPRGVQGFWQNAKWDIEGGRLVSPILYSICRVVLDRAILAFSPKGPILGEAQLGRTNRFDGPFYSEFLKRHLIVEDGKSGEYRKEPNVETSNRWRETGRGSGKNSGSDSQEIPEEIIVSRGPLVSYTVEIQINHKISKNLNRKAFQRLLLSTGVKERCLSGNRPGPPPCSFLLKIISKVKFSAEWSHFKECDSSNGTFYGVGKKGDNCSFTLPYMVASNGVPCLNLGKYFLAKFDFNSGRGQDYLLVITHKDRSEGVTAAESGWPDLVERNKALKILGEARKIHPSKWRFVETWIPRFHVRAKGVEGGIYVKGPEGKNWPITIVSESEIDVKEKGVCFKSMMEINVLGARKVGWMFRFDHPFIFFIVKGEDLIAMGEFLGI